MMTKANPTPQKRQAPSYHSASATGWKVANERLCSVLAHPFGFPLLLLFDYVEKFVDGDIQTWDEANLEEFMDLVYLGGDHLNLLKAIKDASSASAEIAGSLGGGIRSWHANTPNPAQTTLTKGISDDLNKTWTVRNRLVSVSEGPAVDANISGRCDVVLYQTVPPPINIAGGGPETMNEQRKSTVATKANSVDVQQDEQMPIVGIERKRTRLQCVPQRKAAAWSSSRGCNEGWTIVGGARRAAIAPPSTPEVIHRTRQNNHSVALLEFGKGNDIWWEKFHQCSQYIDQKLNGKPMDKPILVAVVA
jgi:hypothetical protein